MQKKAHGYGDISIRMLKLSSPSIIKPLLYFSISALYLAVVQWLSLLHFIQLSLNSGSMHVQILFVLCQRFTKVRISDNGPGWK